MDIDANDVWDWSRPFTGAWIETMTKALSLGREKCRPFTGAWIETNEENIARCALQSPLHGGVD